MSQKPRVNSQRPIARFWQISVFRAHHSPPRSERHRSLFRQGDARTCVTSLRDKGTVGQIRSFGCLVRREERFPPRQNKRHGTPALPRFLNEGKGMGTHHSLSRPYGMLLRGREVWPSWRNLTQPRPRRFGVVLEHNRSTSRLLTTCSWLLLREAGPFWCRGCD